MADMLTPTDGGKHRDARPAETLKSENLASKAPAAVRSFLNPFSSDCKGKMLILSSGAAGKEAKNNFTTERIETSTNFFEPITRLKLKTLGDMSKRGKLRPPKTTVSTAGKYCHSSAYEVSGGGGRYQSGSKKLKKYPVPCPI